jgi:hypothetical protein
MRRMSELSHQHGRSGVLETQTQPNDGASHCEHHQPVREGLQEHAEDDDHGANDDGVLPTNLLDEPPQEELRDDTAEALGAVKDA